MTLTLKSKWNILRWLQDRNKVHNKFNVLGSSQNHSLALVHGKNCLLQNQLLVPKRLRLVPLEGSPLVHFGCSSPGGKESTGPVNIPTQSPHSLSRAHFLGWDQISSRSILLRADHSVAVFTPRLTKCPWGSCLLQRGVVRWEQECE